MVDYGKREVWVFRRAGKDLLIMMITTENGRVWDDTYTREKNNERNKISEAEKEDDDGGFLRTRARRQYYLQWFTVHVVDCHISGHFQ